MVSEQVILVNGRDQEIGVCEKMQAHREAKLHRAFSIFIFNQEREVLLQRRALTKYHSGGLWANTCCGHPRPGEKVKRSAVRRLEEELGVMCGLEKKFSFVYTAKVGIDLYENEYDHVFFGNFDGTPRGNPAEVDDVRLIALPSLKEDMQKRPQEYAPWLNIILHGYAKFF